MGEKLQPDCLAEIIIAAVMKIDSRTLFDGAVTHTIIDLMRDESPV
ncbi:hypothetical protein ACB376_29850 [Klebsiella electrica]